MSDGNIPLTYTPQSKSFSLALRLTVNGALHDDLFCSSIEVELYHARDYRRRHGEKLSLRGLLSVRCGRVIKPLNLSALTRGMDARLCGGDTARLHAVLRSRTAGTNVGNLC